MKKRSQNISMLVARKEKGYTQGELAAEVNRSRFWINRIENNDERPSPELAALIAEKLDKTFEDLFSKEVEK